MTNQPVTWDKNLKNADKTKKIIACIEMPIKCRFINQATWFEGGYASFDDKIHAPQWCFSIERDLMSGEVLSISPVLADNYSFVGWAYMPKPEEN